MSEQRMRAHIDEVLRKMELAELEQRIAPVKCEKNPDAPECQAVALYAVAEYGVDAPMYGVDAP